MQPDTQSLRAILKQYVGPSYERALRNTGSEARAREAARRAMELLKLALEEGVEPTKALVLRITDDCCNQDAFYNRQQEAQPPAQKLAEPEMAAPAPPRPVVQEAIASPAPKMEAASVAATQAAPASLPAQKNPSRARRAKEKVSPGSVLLVILLSMIVVLLVILFTVLLCAPGISPEGGLGFAAGVYEWISTHIFPLH